MDGWHGPRLDVNGLLRLEKRRRGVSEDKLLFVNAANLASFWWCAQKSLLHTREIEPDIFANYVLQGVEIASLDRIEDPLDLLQLVERMYKTRTPDEVLRKKETGVHPEAEVEVYSVVEIGNRVLTLIRRGDRLVILGKRLEVVDECDLIRGGRGGVCEEALKAACTSPERVRWRLEDLEWMWELEGLDRRLARGVVLQDILAERRPTVLWAREWDRYVVVGVPDGVGGDFVYEFKSTKLRRLKYLLPVARAQANIYTWLFNKRRWVVEIFSCADLKLYRQEGEADYAEVEKTLRGFKAVEESGEATPPMCWKCRTCEYRDRCEVKDRCR